MDHVNKERIRAAFSDVSNMETLLTDIGQFAQTLIVCGCSDDPIETEVVDVIGRHFRRLAHEAEGQRQQAFRALHPLLVNTQEGGQ